MEKYTYRRNPSALLAVAENLFIRFPSFRIPSFVDRGKLLEVGFGNGEALVRMRKLGWRVCGTDLSEEARNNARLRLFIDVVDTDGTHLAAPDCSFDVITLFHTLEHLTDPLAGLREYARLLMPGGQLLLEVPNFGCLQSVFFRNRWRGLEVPRHLSHFTKHTLNLMVKKAGFMDVMVRPVVASPVNVFRPSLPPKIENDREHHRRIWSRSRVITKAVFVLGPTAGLGDSLFLTARKPI
jgi:SAM-dependent methyltransferase